MESRSGADPPDAGAVPRGTAPTPPDPWDTAELLAAVVRQRQAELDAKSKASKAAIEEAGLANSNLTAVLVPYRQLVAALAGNAGHDKGAPSLDEAHAYALDVLAELGIIDG